MCALSFCGCFFLDLTEDGLWLIHLPEGPTAYFKLSNFRQGRHIKGHGRPTSHKPEVILNHFTTRLGHTVGRMLAALFPQDPQFVGRRVVTFHNQRDFIFFRHHRLALDCILLTISLLY